MKIYLVIGESGSHDDWDTWIVGAFLDADKAAQECHKLSESVRPAKERAERLFDLRVRLGGWGSLEQKLDGEKEVGWTYEDWKDAETTYKVQEQEVQE